MELKTPLYEKHIELGGKIVPFAGYLLPVQYEGVIKEHLAVRNDVGIFDVSHMGEIIFKGPGALNSLNHIMTNDFTNMKIGKVRYSPMCNEDGGVIDDLLVYKLDENYYFVVVNASNRSKDFKHIKNNVLENTTVEDISDSVGQIALQGPKAKQLLTSICEDDLPDKYYTAKNHVVIQGIDVLVSTTGYTGEDGYELYASNDDIVKLWDLLLEKGRDYSLHPCGLGARDTLRLEASMPLYGHEMDESISPLETNLDFGVKLNKEEFIGKEGLIKKGEPRIKRVGLKIIDRGVLREHQDIYVEEKLIGHTTSGTYSPLFKTSIAMALINKEFAEVDSIVEVDVRGKKLQAKVVEMPFYKKK